MAEEENNKKERITKDDLASLILNTKDVEIEGINKTFGIRSLTWKEDSDIDAAVMQMDFAEAKTEQDRRNARARERMRLIVQSGVVDPRLTKQEVINLPVGLVIRLAREIDALSSYLPKNE